jgi:hypothetical protein
VAGAVPGTPALLALGETGTFRRLELQQRQQVILVVNGRVLKPDVVSRLRREYEGLVVRTTLLSAASIRPGIKRKKTEDAEERTALRAKKVLGSCFS